jgi:gamma-tubulin complex component 3
MQALLQPLAVPEALPGLERAGAANPSEEAVARECLWALQGVPGRVFVRQTQAQALEVSAAVVRAVPRAQAALLERVAEAGSRFAALEAELQRARGEGGGGGGGGGGGPATRQAFLAALQAELRQLQGRLAGMREGPLRRLWVQASPVCRALRHMAELLAGCEGLRGGQLVNALRREAWHGDPERAALAARLERAAARPLARALAAWAARGELRDPHEEFFVAEEPAAPLERLWQERYRLREEQLPERLGLGLARAALALGKALNFLRLLCRDEPWVQRQQLQGEEGDAAEAEAEVELEMLEAEAWRGRLERAGARVHGRLVRMLREREGLVAAARAQHELVLLARGDFAAYLLEGLARELSRPAALVARSALLPLVERAGRLARLEGEAVRLDVRLEEGQASWRAFALEYRLEGPLEAVFSRELRARLLRLQRQLLALRRVQGTLAGLWARLLQVGRALGPRHALLLVDLQAPLLLRRRMELLAAALQGALAEEPLRKAWPRLQRALEAAPDLDRLLAAYEAYLAELEAHALLPGPLQALLEPLLQAAEDYCALLDRVAQAVLEEHAIRRKRARSSEDACRSEAEPIRLAPPARQELNRLETVYRSRLDLFAQALASAHLPLRLRLEPVLAAG